MRRRVLSAVTMAAIAFSLHAAPAPAPVPPKDCGFLQAGGIRVNVKSDKLRCKRARKYTRKYLNGRGKPSGYTCTRYDPQETNVEFRCAKGSHVFLAIRR